MGVFLELREAKQVRNTGGLCSDQCKGRETSGTKESENNGRGKEWRQSLPKIKKPLVVREGGEDGFVFWDSVHLSKQAELRR